MRIEAFFPALFRSHRLALKKIKKNSKYGLTKITYLVES